MSSIDKELKVLDDFFEMHYKERYDLNSAQMPKLINKDAQQEMKACIVLVEEDILFYESLPDISDAVNNVENPREYKILKINPTLKEQIITCFNDLVDYYAKINAYEKIADLRFANTYCPDYIERYKYEYFKEISNDETLSMLRFYLEHTEVPDIYLIEEIQCHVKKLFEFWYYHSNDNKQSRNSVLYSLKEFQIRTKIREAELILDFFSPQQKRKTEPTYLTRHFLKPKKDIPFVIQMCKDLGLINEAEKWIYKKQGIDALIVALGEESIMIERYPTLTKTYPDFAERFGLELNYNKAKKNRSPYLNARKKIKQYLKTYYKMGA